MFQPINGDALLYSSGTHPLKISCKSVHDELDGGVDYNDDNIDTNGTPAADDDLNATPGDDVDFTDTPGEATQDHPLANGHSYYGKRHANTLTILVLIRMM